MIHRLIILSPIESNLSLALRGINQFPLVDSSRVLVVHLEFATSGHICLGHNIR
jgi:hypothetical protein